MIPFESNRQGIQGNNFALASGEIEILIGSEVSMPIFIVILLAVLIAQIGFWDTFSALLGAVGMLVLLVLVLVALISLGGYLIYRRVRHRYFPGPATPIFAPPPDRHRKHESS